MVPDTFWLLSVWICCAIHDHMYRDPKALSRRDKEIADELLLTNLAKWIKAKSWPVIRTARMYRAMSYYNGVIEGGDSSFWGKGKAKPAEV